jgi:L-amino acid N-acyltransferase YncA
VKSKGGVRFANANDWQKVSHIYNEIIDERVATLNTEHNTDTDVSQWVNEGIFLVYSIDEKIAGFVRSFPYRDRNCYSGVSQFSVYVSKKFRRMGVGDSLLKRLIAELKDNDCWKLVSRVFTENIGSRKLLLNHEFREVGIYEKHGKLDDKWRDVVIVEYILFPEI